MLSDDDRRWVQLTSDSTAGDGAEEMPKVKRLQKGQAVKLGFFTAVAFVRRPCHAVKRLNLSGLVA